ncbi:MAG: hypothetical protein Q9160_006483 [Pyrenula sp. 1 TL-2023]
MTLWSDESHINIFDIAPSGSISEWQIDLPEFDQPTLDWARANCDALHANGRNDETRLIVFEEASRFWAQELVGVHYGMEPVFFRDIAHSYAARHSPAAWERYDQRVPDFLIGCTSQHLNLGYGWTCKIVRCDQSVQAGPKTITVVSAAKMIMSSSAATLLDQTVSIGYLIFADEERWLRIGKGQWRQQPQVVEYAWHRLRMLKYDGAGPVECFRQYNSDHYESQTQKREEYTIVSKRLDSVMRSICRTEELAHDYLQAHVEETKRIKIVTVLAIFFVPISLSTSIFGMNINELNAEGQSLKVFVGTMIWIFAATLLMWGLMYQRHKWKSLPEGRWSEKKPASKTEDEPDYPVAWRVRLRQFSRLVWHGHIIWAWQSRIGLSLLTIGRKGFNKSCSGHDEQYWDRENLSYEAPEYLDKHVDYAFIDDMYSPCNYIVAHLDQGMGFDCSKLEVV